MELHVMEGVTPLPTDPRHGGCDPSPPLPTDPRTHPGQVDEGGPDGGHCGTADECLSADVEVAVLNLVGTEEMGGVRVRVPSSVRGGGGRYEGKVVPGMHGRYLLITFQQTYLPILLYMHACMHAASPACSPLTKRQYVRRPLHAAHPHLPMRSTSPASSPVPPAHACMVGQPPMLPHAWAHASPRPSPHTYLHTGQLDLVFGNQAAQSTDVVVLLSSRGAQVGDTFVQGLQGLPGKRLGAGRLRHLTLLRGPPYASFGRVSISRRPPQLDDSDIDTLPDMLR